MQGYHPDWKAIALSIKEQNNWRCSCCGRAKKSGGDLKTRFKGKGLGTSRNQRPVGAVLPPEHDKIVRSIPNRSDWIREAIAEKLEREGLLPKAG